MQIEHAFVLFLQHLKALGRSPYTVRNAGQGLKSLGNFLEKEKVYVIEALTPDLLEEFQLDLSTRANKKGGLLTLRTQAQCLGTVKVFTRFLKEKDYLLRDPAINLKLPKKPQSLPKVILSQKEVKSIISAPDRRSHKGYRDRVVLEILYDTGIRRSEVNSIRLSDLDLEGGYIRIQGKGNKERVVPVSKRVCSLIDNYITMVRPYLLTRPDPGFLILNRWGKRMSPRGIGDIVYRHAKNACIEKKISTHTFRHTCATHMLKAGAPVRHIQEMLGHESLDSTMIYTRVTINDLKEIHAKYHPGEKMDID